eukprot:gene2805-5522_t
MKITFDSSEPINKNDLHIPRTGIEEGMLILQAIETGNFTIEKMDSAASRCMSGDSSRISNSNNVSQVTILGFNRSMSKPDRVGLNRDGKQEYYVSSMPSNLALLCAHAYAEDGAVILFGDGGMVLRLQSDQLNELKQFLSQYPKEKILRVNNRTYEVEDKTINMNDNTILNIIDTNNVNESSNSSTDIESAFSNTAVRYFNTKVNVSNTTERILTLLMTGLSFQDWYSHIQNNSLDGIPMDVDMKSLNHFEHKYGRTPDIVRLAIPLNTPSHTGLMEPKDILDHVGQRYEIDCMESDYNNNESKKSSDDSNNNLIIKNKKLKTHGGARAAAVGVDCYSSYVSGKLLKSVANPELFVEEMIMKVENAGHKIQKLAADSGVLTASVFQVITPKVESLCLLKNITPERAEPYNHARGTGSVEVSIKLIKELIRLAVTLILRNPNFKVTGFNDIDIYKLWGEFFLWAITVINFKPCPIDSSKSRYEVFYNRKPNMQNIRLLPIGSILIVLRHVPQADSVTNQYYSQIAIYVGPSLTTPGAARVAVKVATGLIRIIITSNFRAASDGGGLNVYPHLDRGLSGLLNEQDTNNKESKKLVAEEFEPESHYYIEDDSFIKSLLHQPVKENTVVRDVNSNNIKNINKVPKSKSKLPVQQYNNNTIVATNKNNNSSSMESEILVAETSVKTNSITNKNKKKNKKKIKNKTGKNMQEIPGMNSTHINNIAHNDHDTLHIENSILEVPDMNSILDKNINNNYILNTNDNLKNIDATCTDNIDSNLRRSSRQRERRQRREELANVASDIAELETSCFADWTTHADDKIYWTWMTDRVPKNFPAALSDLKWGQPARTELNTLISTKAIVEIDATLERDAIKNEEADLVYLFPDYEHIDEIGAFLNAQYKGNHKAFTKFRGDNKYYAILGALYGLKT